MWIFFFSLFLLLIFLMFKSWGTKLLLLQVCSLLPFNNASEHNSVWQLVVKFHPLSRCLPGKLCTPPKSKKKRVPPPWLIRSISLRCYFPQCSTSALQCLYVIKVGPPGIQTSLSKRRNTLKDKLTARKEKKTSTSSERKETEKLPQSLTARAVIVREPHGFSQAV